MRTFTMNMTMEATTEASSREDREQEYTRARERALIGDGVPDSILRKVVELMPGGCSIVSIDPFNGGPSYSVELDEWITGERFLLYNYSPWSGTFKEVAWRARSGPYATWQWHKQYKKRKR